MFKLRYRTKLFERARRHHVGSPVVARRVPATSFPQIRARPLGRGRDVVLREALCCIVDAGFDKVTARSRMARYIHVLLVLCLSWSALAVSDEALPKAELQTSIGISAMVFDYAEYGDNGGLLDYEYGVLPGVSADISRAYQDWFVAGKMSYYAGDVLYDGQTQARVPVTTHTDENILDLFVQAGHQHRPIDHFGYAFYAGVGHHRWDRDIHSTRTVSGLTELYRWEYAALGAKLISRETNRATWEMNLRWQHVLNPLLDINFRGTFDSLQLALGERDGIYFSVPWTKRLNERRHFIIEPFYERWILGRSANRSLTSQGTVVGTVFEPRSVANNRGVTVSVRSTF